MSCRKDVLVLLLVPHSSPASKMQHSLHTTALHKDDPVIYYLRGSVCQRGPGQEVERMGGVYF